MAYSNQWIKIPGRLNGEGLHEGFYNIKPTFKSPKKDMRSQFNQKDSLLFKWLSFYHLMLNSYIHTLGDKKCHTSNKLLIFQTPK